MFDALLAVLSGVLLALSFPKFGHPALGWIALAPLLVAVTGQRPFRGFLLGLIAGIIYFGGTLYWISRVMIVYGHMPAAGAVAVNAAFDAYLALFPGLFGAVMAAVTRSLSVRMLLTAPFVWVATELGRTYFLTGFPWVLLGNSQATVLPIAQIASVLGVYGVSAIVALVSAALAVAASRQFTPLVVTLVAVAAIAVWGEVRIRQSSLTSTGEPARIGLIQGNVSIDEKLDTAQAPRIFARYLRMSHLAIDRGATALIWPESATPFVFGQNLGGTDQIRALARDARVSVLLGSDQVEFSDPPKYWNAAFMVRPDGSTAGAYRKIHLVPFGEYVPARHVFFFMDRIVEATIDFSPGEAPTLLPIDGHKVSTSICYEVIFPALVRDFTLEGAELLTTITNDAWFGPTSAPFQHFEQASMRAIENGRYLVRSANTGISGIVDPYGRVTMRSNTFEEATLVGDVRFLHGMTIYARIGDVLAYASLVTTLALVAAAWWPSRGQARRIQ